MRYELADYEWIAIKAHAAEERTSPTLPAP
jgi:hypothetical protein